VRALDKVRYVNPSNAAPIAPEPSPRGIEVRVPKAAELVAGQIRNDIVRGHIAEGDALPPESALMVQFGVSRPTLREAFRVLESEALITVSRGARGGARVQVPKTEVAARYASLVLQLRGATLGDVLETRSTIEPPLAGRLARKRTAADLKRLTATFEDAKGLTGDEARAAQHHFHQVVIDLAGNEALRVIMGILEHILRAATANRSRRSAREEESFIQEAGMRSHGRLIELIEAKDGDGAERLWRKHLDETTKWLGDEVSVPVMELFA